MLPLPAAAFDLAHLITPAAKAALDEGRLPAYDSLHCKCGMLGRMSIFGSVVACCEDCVCLSTRVFVSL